jgi:hypothetical protein
MLKRSVLSIFCGAALATMLLFGASAAAHCNGYCDDLDGYTYAGCSLHYDENGRVDVAVCAYTKGGAMEMQ